MNGTWVLLRGLTRESRHWGAFADDLRREFPDADIVALDLPGNGVHNGERSPADVPAMMRACRAELASRGFRPPYRLLAMSLGAMVAVAWAVEHAEELEGCVLINISLRPFSPMHWRLRPAALAALLRIALSGHDGRGAESRVLQLTSGHAAAHAALLDDWAAWRRERPVSHANAVRQLVAAARFRAPQAAPRVPLLLLASKRDRLVDVRCSRALAARWHCPLAEHPDAGHDLPLDAASWATRQVHVWWMDAAASARLQFSR